MRDATIQTQQGAHLMIHVWYLRKCVIYVDHLVSARTFCLVLYAERVFILIAFNYFRQTVMKIMMIRRQLC